MKQISLNLGGQNSEGWNLNSMPKNFIFQVVLVYLQ